MKKIKGKLKNGFNFELDPGLLNDYELLEMISEGQTNPLVIPKLITKVLGEKQKNNLINYLKKKTGKVTIEDMELALTEIFTKSKPLKN